MFSYELPDGGLRARCYINSEGDIKFDPPVYEQRYTTAVRILEDSRWGHKFKKVVDFGCADMRLLSLLRRVEGIEQILEFHNVSLDHYVPALEFVAIVRDGANKHGAFVC
ncbi:small RNA 2'-O-methyltransferase-like [Rhagoletis pomonella]|uniref:small RNA 2'-O-methyltransferase-like n=1 Tax=Rhagoletis pomonella TaxID=28610 RepID=UPI00178615E9|nr:small RNA 2'-O-methyltransferase-like [Rhagoletis pomonella]